ADMGSRDAQYVLGDMISSIDDDATRPFRLDLMKKLYQCAAEQGQKDAAYWLGMFLPDENKYKEAVDAYHLAIKSGKDSAARRLSRAFTGNLKEGDIDFLNLAQDAERARRYNIISDYLSNYDFMSPKVPDLDEIVPLPPAPLPEWDGKIAFQRWVEGKEPPKPSDELMKKLADQAKLDVKTGLPLAEPTQPEAAKAY
ncbi:DUF6396 domain-containing protein, partial [Neisseria sp. 74A18]|uniref:DUF6396 domain-containing protein n=1 Tax=Neisseria sp. 74A18 TaxID=1696094 RepID=UPI000ACE32B3